MKDIDLLHQAHDAISQVMQGCWDVTSDKDVHKDSKTLASLIRKDLHKVKDALSDKLNGDGRQRSITVDITHVVLQAVKQERRECIKICDQFIQDCSGLSTESAIYHRSQVAGLISSLIQERR